MLTGVLAWIVYVAFSPDKAAVSRDLTEHLGELSGILFFLLCAMTVVELIDAHDEFEVNTSRIEPQQAQAALGICFLTFLSSVLDRNLRTRIVVVDACRGEATENSVAWLLRSLCISPVHAVASSSVVWKPLIINQTDNPR